MNVNITDIRKRIKKDVPLIEGAWVEFYDDITVNDMENAQKMSKDETTMDERLLFIASQIAGWNFADDNGDLPINSDSLKLIPFKVLNWIVDTQQGNDSDAKKKISDEVDNSASKS